MLFSKYYQPNNRCGGRKPSAATIEKRQAEARAELERQQEVFNDFMNAESGDFDGFKFAYVFHDEIRKTDAIYIGDADDCANVVTPFGTFDAGVAGRTAYFFSKQPKKTVFFNRSIYFF